MAGGQQGGRPVAVVTGGGGGIGAAVAEAIGRSGTYVVTVDPLVSLDGAEQLPPPEETTAGRIVAAGGAARASSASVTDRAALGDLFEEVVAEHGRLDAVVNVAGITRPTSFARGTEEDWRSVLAVHLDGYLNVLGAALPHLARAGTGRVVGVTSGSGWRAADTGAYGCAKRAVAALTWQLGRVAPAGVSVNAMSPIAVTRMVTAALERAAAAAERGNGGGSATGGLSLGSMPDPDQLGPFGAYLASEAAGWLRGRVLFAGGPEVAVVDEPRLLEVVRTSEVVSVAGVLDAATTALVAAESQQATTGGTNPRFAQAFDDGPTDLDRGAAAPTCLVVAADDAVGRGMAAALDARGGRASVLPADRIGAGFDAPAAALAAAIERVGPLDAVVVALAGPRASDASEGWSRVLAEHVGLPDAIAADAAWARAVADLARTTERSIRLVTLVDAATAGGRSRAQAAAQHARAALGATRDRVAAFAVALEGPSADAAPLAAHLVCHPGASGLSGAELVVDDGWVGLRSHPRPTGSISFGGPDLPPWFGDVLRRAAGTEEAP